MTDQQTNPEPPEPPAWQKLPSDMAVLGVPTVFATNVGQDGMIWLWLRQPNSCTAVELGQEGCDLMIKGLAGALEYSLRAHPPAPKIEPVVAPLFGPDGRPMNGRHP